jgi:hypothetical protein
MSLKLIKNISDILTNLISETNGITLVDTLDLAIESEYSKDNRKIRKSLQEFRKLISGYQQGDVDIHTLLSHPVSDALKIFFKNFPLPYREEHIHLTGSLTADFVWPRLRPLLKGPNKDIYWKKN